MSSALSGLARPVVVIANYSHLANTLLATSDALAAKSVTRLA